jgi:hypothetical protein
MNLRKIGVRALKAATKGILLYVLYFVLSLFLAPVVKIIPTLQQSIEAFVTLYLVLMVIGDFMAGTIYHYFFGAGKSLFVIFYLILSLKSGVVSATFGSINLLVDLRLFLVIAMLLSLLGLARSVFQAVNFMNEKASLPEFGL